MTLNLHAMVSRFTERWGPKEGEAEYHLFLFELRDLLENYGIAMLAHQSFPDTEHRHGEPIHRKEKNQ